MNYYFLGIGGIGMSALARFFHRRGDRVAGYDHTPSPLTAQLEQEGITIHYDDAPDRIPYPIDMVVYTPAIPSDLGEMKALLASGIPMKKRSQVLGEIIRGKQCLAVAGSHGKTTTSTLIAHLLTQGATGCSAFLGGIAKDFDSNLLVNNASRYIVVEADEYDRSFLQLYPHMAAITATDPDHLDIYGTHESMLDAFVTFASQVEAGGFLLVQENTFRLSDGTPYRNIEQLRSQCKADIFTYSSHPDSAADYRATNTHVVGGDILFDLVTPNGCICGLRLCGTSLYNIENAVAASAIALACGTSEEQLRQGLASFSGVRRRFDYRIRDRRLIYIDDYAHHPAELHSTISSVRALYPGRRLLGIFQPHLYSRTRDFASQFATALSELDELILMPIYPAREEPIPGITSSTILDRVSIANKHLCTPDQVLRLVPTLAPDIVLTLGAGDIDRLVPQLEHTLTSLLS